MRDSFHSGAPSECSAILTEPLVNPNNQNYVFDKRFAHPPPVQQARAPAKDGGPSEAPPPAALATDGATDSAPLGRCEACGRAWDMYRGKRRCPTCGVPSLICRDCWRAHDSGVRRIDASVRCDLCVAQNVRSKRDLREREQRALQAYEEKLLRQGLLLPRGTEWLTEANPQKATRLFLKNMCRRSMTEAELRRTLPGVTHIVWRTDRQSGAFLGQGWVEMESPEAAALAVARSGERVLGRPLHVEYQPPDGKDRWPPPHSAVGGSSAAANEEV